MKPVRIFVVLALLFGILTPPAEAATTRIIVRVNGGLPVLRVVCALLRCTVNYGLGDPDGQVFVISTQALSGVTFLNTLKLQLGIVSAEIDVAGSAREGATGTTPPAALYDSTPTDYYGSSVRHGYVAQPATQIINLARAQSQYRVDGSGIVAVIDTGVDTAHPALQGVLLPGYDFTRNQDGADEKGDVTQSTAAVVDGSAPAWVNQSTAAVVDQSTAAVVDGGPATSDFGHGTMTAGLVHLVAPRAWILPLKAFSANGTGYASDVIRAIYKAVNANARVINMSFSFTSSSKELSNAITYASQQHVILVAAAGNNGARETVYPAGYSDRVIGVASTSNDDARSTFSNYGRPLVWVAAPGEGVVTTYPFSTYAAAWGTSFSTPMVAGAAALLLDVNGGESQSDAAAAVANAKFVSIDMGNGRIDLVRAIAAARALLGLR